MKPRIGLLALSLELYETIAPGLRADRERWLAGRIVPRLAAHADVRFSEIAYRREDIERVVTEHHAAGVDALLVVCASYSPSQLALGALQRAGLPLFLWNTQELYGVGADFNGEKLLGNHGVHGTQDLANVLVRQGVPFEYVTSHVDDAGGLTELADLFTAAAAAARLRRARLGLMGGPFPGMGDFAVDTTHLVGTLGCQWVPLPVEHYIHRAEAAPDAEVTRLKDEYRRAYDVAADLTDLDLEVTARAEWALRTLAAEQRIDALSYQFMAFGEDERTVTLPFVAASRMMADGIGFAGEGDLVGAAGTFLLGQLQPPATFAEVFTIDFEGNSLLMSHMGEANVAMARKDRKPPLVARDKPIVRIRGKQLALITSLEPGPVTLVAMTQGPAGRWRILASRMAAANWPAVAGMPVPHFKIKPEGRDVRDWLTNYAKLGGPHHLALCFGDARRRVHAAARLLDADYFEI